MLKGRIKKWHAKTDIPKTSDTNTNSPCHAKHKKFAYKHRKKIQQSVSKTYVTGSDKIALKESPDSLENAETSFLPLNPQPFSTPISFPPAPDPPVPCKY